jgi:hypothetical protein
MCLDCGRELPTVGDEMKAVSAASSEASPHDDVSNPTTKLAED